MLAFRLTACARLLGGRASKAGMRLVHMKCACRDVQRLSVLLVVFAVLQAFFCFLSISLFAFDPLIRLEVLFCKGV